MNIFNCCGSRVVRRGEEGGHPSFMPTADGSAPVPRKSGDDSGSNKQCGLGIAFKVQSRPSQPSLYADQSAPPLPQQNISSTLHQSSTPNKPSSSCPFLDSHPDPERMPRHLRPASTDASDHWLWLCVSSQTKRGNCLLNASSREALPSLSALSRFTRQPASPLPLCSPSPPLTLPPVPLFLSPVLSHNVSPVRHSSFFLLNRKPGSCQTHASSPHFADVSLSVSLSLSHSPHTHTHTHTHFPHFQPIPPTRYSLSLMSSTWPAR
jgi:hypothetical protein